MKLKLKFELPEIIIVTDTGHGCVEQIICKDRDYGDVALVDFVLSVIGHGAINDEMAREQDRLSEVPNGSH